MCHTSGLLADIAIWPEVVVVGHKVVRGGPSELIFALPHKWKILIILRPKPSF